MAMTAERAELHLHLGRGVYGGEEVGHPFVLVRFPVQHLRQMYDVAGDGRWTPFQFVLATASLCDFTRIFGGRVEFLFRRVNGCPQTFDNLGPIFTVPQL